MSIYNYKVAWCNVCDQGWVEIVKSVESSSLLLQCSECFSQWESFNAYQDKIFSEDEVVVTKPEFAEIENLGWDILIIES